MGCAVVQLGVWALFAVQVDPIPDPFPVFAYRLKRVQINTLILQLPPLPFNHDFVNPTALAIYGDIYTGILQRLGELITVELAALVRVEDIRDTILA